MAKQKKKKISRKAAPRKAKPARKVSAKKSKAAHVRASSRPTETLLGRNHSVRKLSPFTRKQKEKLLQLRDAMVDSMAGVAQDTLRSRAEGGEANRARHLRNLRDVGQTDPARTSGSDPVRAVHC